MRNSNPMSASLEKFEHFYIFKVKYDFSTNEVMNKCNTSFVYDFNWAIHFGNYFDGIILEI